MRAGAYVYVIFDRDAVPRYVGKGRGNRWRAHRSGSHNAALDRLAKETDGELPIIIVRDDLTDDEAFALEIDLIKTIGRGDDGPLLNLCDGGGGVRHTPQSRAKLSAARKGKSLSSKSKENIRLGHLGMKYSAEHRAAISAALKGKKKTPAHRAALKKAKRPHLKGPISEKRRVAIQAALTKFWASRRKAGLPLKHPRKEKAR